MIGKGIEAKIAHTPTGRRESVQYEIFLIEENNNIA